MCPDKKRPAGNTCRIAKGFDAVWAHFCPSKPCLPLSIDGMEQYSTLPAEFHPCLRNCALRRPNIHIPRINIRYVGKPHAAIIYNDRLTLEKYIDSFETGEWYSADGYLISRQTVGESVTMPKAFGSAVISPDNTGCYIITVKQ